MIKFSVSVHIINMHSRSHIRSVILEIIIKRLISLGEHNFSPMQSSRFARSLNRISHHLKPKQQLLSPKALTFFIVIFLTKTPGSSFLLLKGDAPVSPSLPAHFRARSEGEITGTLLRRTFPPKPGLHFHETLPCCRFLFI